MEQGQMFIMAGGFFVFLIIIGLIVYFTVFNKKKEDDETEEEEEEEGEGEGKETVSSGNVDPNGNVIKGLTTANLVTGSRTKFVKAPGDSMAECRKKAKQYGFMATGHRNSDYPDSNLKNTCFFYTKAEPRWSGEKRDLTQVSGCTDASKKWPNCGTKGMVIPGWTRTNLNTKYDFRAKDITECRKKAKELEFVGVGYRTSEHPVMENKDTCFFYDGTDANFKGNLRDQANVTGCADAEKIWPDC